MAAYRRTMVDGRHLEAEDREYSFEELLELAAEHVTLLRSLRGLGYVDTAKEKVKKDAVKKAREAEKKREEMLKRL